MQPTDHTSMAFVYSFQERITSGARYQRVATYLAKEIREGGKLSR